MERLLGTPDPPEKVIERNEQDRALWLAVDSLDEKHRLVVILHYVHELPAKEIASILGISEGTVYSRLHHARLELHGKIRRASALEVAER